MGEQRCLDCHANKSTRKGKGTFVLSAIYVAAKSCDFHDAVQEKCSKYWPDNVELYDNICVRLSKVVSTSEFDVRTLIAKQVPMLLSKWNLKPDVYFLTSIEWRRRGTNYKTISFHWLAWPQSSYLSNFTAQPYETCSSSSRSDRDARPHCSSLQVFSNLLIVVMDVK